MRKIAFAAALFWFVAGTAQAVTTGSQGTAPVDSWLQNQTLDGLSIPGQNPQPTASSSRAIVIAKGPKHKGDDHPGRGGRGGGPPGKSKHKGKGHGKGHHPFANSSLPSWAHDCGLPPGLAKQNKVPPGWEKKCKSGKKYYDHEAEFRKDVYQGGTIGHDSPAYQTVYAMDDSACKVKSITSLGDIAEGVVKGAVFGGLIGAAGGAIYGAATEADVKDSAITGGAGGAAGGAVLGGILASSDYKSSYRHCMNKRGHRVN